MKMPSSFIKIATPEASIQIPLAAAGPVVFFCAF